MTSNFRGKHFGISNEFLNNKIIKSKNVTKQGQLRGVCPPTSGTIAKIQSLYGQLAIGNTPICMYVINKKLPLWHVEDFPHFHRVHSIEKSFPVIVQHVAIATQLCDMYTHTQKRKLFSQSLMYKTNAHIYNTHMHIRPDSTILQIKYVQILKFMSRKVELFTRKQKNQHYFCVKTQFYETSLELFIRN